MFFSIQELEVRKIPFNESFEPGKVDFSGSGLRQTSALTSSGIARLLEDTGGEVRVTGSLRVEVEADCDRCLAVARFLVEQDFDLFYSPAPEVDADEIEIHDSETEMSFYQGEGFDLAEVMRDQILLALPMQRICREDCRGICPLCGANRNETACRCEVKTADDRWGALKGFHASREAKGS
ncbi:MAG: DUF177 domain-containing protein [Bryobacterales bacterium]|nr:DUF177 domain-containing protein [Bryobacterales bacterium]